MAPSRFPLLDSATQVQGSSDAGAGMQCSREIAHAGKGGKLRSSRVSLFKKKPYDRPLPSDTVDRRVPSSRQTSSLPARLVDSASNLLTSSASYLFESFFKRRQIRWISNGSQSAGGKSSADARQADDPNLPLENDRCPIEISSQGLSDGKVSEEDVEFRVVEEFLKHQSLSRDDLKRLTNVLQTRADGGSTNGVNSEASRQRNAIIQASKESNPAQLAKVFMGSRLTQQLQSTPSRFREGIGLVPGEISDYHAGGSRPLEASRRRVAAGASALSLKRRLISDEDDVVRTVPTRRVRQKMAVTTNSSPYIRQLTAAAGRPNRPSTELKKPMDETEKSLLEGSLISRGKSVEEPGTVSGPCGDADAPESSKVRDSAPKDSYMLLASSEPVEPFKKQQEPVATAVSSLPEAGVNIEPISEAPAARAKGFHINAFFEESSSDEEANLPQALSLLSEAQAPRLAVLNEKSLCETTAFRSSVGNDAQEENLVKQPLAGTLGVSPLFSDPNSGKMPVPAVQQGMGGTGPSNTKSESLPVVLMAAQRPVEAAFIGSIADKPSMSVTSSNLLSLNSHLPLLADKNAKSIDVPAFTTKMPIIWSSESLSSYPLPTLTSPTLSPPLEASFPASQAEAATASLISSPLVTTEKDSIKKEGMKRKVEATQNAETNNVSFSSASQPAPKSDNVAPNILIAADPKIFAASEQSALLVSPTSFFDTTPAPTTAANQAAMKETQPINGTATGSPLETCVRHSPMLESPSGENRQNDMDTMATDPMTEEIDGSNGVSTASGSLFGSASNAVSTSTGEAFKFGSHPSQSPFSFSMQSSTPGVSQSPFSSQSGGSAGQLFSFGGSEPSTVANPFSAATQSTFSFRSSAPPSISPIFSAASSAPSTFPATSPASSPFLFGANASSSTATSSSMFGGQTTQSANGFTSGTAQNLTSAFSFQASPTTPSPAAFQFGAANAGTSVSSAPLFGGQTFGFGAQPPNNAPANPFTQSGGSNASPFQFGTAPPIASQPITFGAQTASSPFSFTFGAQNTPPPAGQPFGFGGQPAAPAPAPFNLPGSTVQGPSGGASGMEFAGGFSLGAAGGEKSGRKFIKAKRIGGAKRGK